MEQFFNFITDTFKTTVTSISSISFGLLLDVPATTNLAVNYGTKILQHASLLLGCIVAIFAILNGSFTLYDNIQKRRGKYKKNKIKDNLKNK